VVNKDCEIARDQRARLNQSGFDAESYGLEQGSTGHPSAKYDSQKTTSDTRETHTEGDTKT
jgi:hypothetical protein